MKKLSALIFLCCFVLTACGNQAAEEEAKKQAAQERAIAECVRCNSHGYSSGGGSSESELRREADKRAIISISLMTNKPMIVLECSKSLTYI